MVGDGPLLEVARRRVTELGLEASVSLPGLAGREEVVALMRQARAFVQHSRVASDGDSEGSPVAVMEAQLCGLPVVATRHGGIPEVVRHGQSGWLVDEGDVEGMAAAMGRFAQDPDLAAHMGVQGQKIVRQNYTVQHHLEAVSNLLSDIALSVPRC